MNPADASSSARRGARVRKVVEDCMRRRAAGEDLPDAVLVARHADLQPELSEELSLLTLFERARGLAGSSTGAEWGHVSRGPTVDRAGGVGDIVQLLGFRGYDVVREIHRGGQGVVYEAVQRSTQRRVAVKVIRTGPFAADGERARFEREVRVLAALRHPHIVAIHDSGTAAGCFYFAMDYIAGLSLDEYVMSREADGAFPIPRKLDLLVKVAEAIHAAHLIGVIHRDIKPSNIRIDDQGRPHVLDFGLAKVTDDASGEASMTVSGQFLGSMPWSSPEQAAGAADKADARTDVYALGLLLYHMLTGRLPYATSGTLREVADRIQTADPARPSGLRRDIDDELETIVLKCLAKEPERRYPSADDLVRDIRRYLNDEPIVARPPSTAYLLRKFARRHRALVGATAAVFVALAIGIVVSTTLYLRAESARLDAESQRRLAEQRERETQKAADFYASLFAGFDVPRMGTRLHADLLSEAAAERPATTTSAPSDLDAALAGANFTNIALKALDANIFEPALDAVGKQFADQPLVRAQLLQTLAATLQRIGLLDQAGPPQTEALRLRRELLGDEHASTIQSFSQMGRLLQARGRLDEAEGILRDNLERSRRVLGDADPDTLVVMNNLGALLAAKGEPAAAEPYYREALTARRRVLGDEHPDTLTSINNLGLALQDLGRLADAEPLFREALDARRRVLGDDHPETLVSISNMGYLLEARGRRAEAEPYYREALDRSRRILGDDHPDTLTSINNMGYLMQVLGRLDEAEVYFRDALEKRRRLLGDEHPDTITAVGNMGGFCMERGRVNDAEAYLRQAYDMARRVYGDEHADTASYITAIAGVLYARGQNDLAEQWYNDAAAKLRRTVGDAHPYTLITLDNLAVVLRSQGKRHEAEMVYREILPAMRRTWGDDHPKTLLAIGSMATVLREDGRPAESEPYIREYIEASARQHGEASWQTAGRRLVLGGVLRELSRFTEAEEELLKAEAAAHTATDAPANASGRCAEELTRLYETWHAAEPHGGHDRQASEWRSRIPLSPPKTSTAPSSRLGDG